MPTQQRPIKVTAEASKRKSPLGAMMMFGRILAVVALLQWRLHMGILFDEAFRHSHHTCVWEGGYVGVGGLGMGLG